MADERSFTVNHRSTKRMKTTTGMAHLHSTDDGVDDHPVAPTRGNTNDDNHTDDIATNILQVVAINTEPPNEVVSKVFDINDLLRQIFEFVGPNQFLFVGTIHPLFRHIYTELFGVMTQCNVSTMDHAEMCLRTGHIPQHYFLPLWNLAIRHNRLHVLYHLRYVYNFSDLTSESFMMAVNYGHLEILQWLDSIGGIISRYQEVICSMAERKGHVHILQFLHQSTIPSTPPIGPSNTATCSIATADPSTASSPPPSSSSSSHSMIDTVSNNVPTDMNDTPTILDDHEGITHPFVLLFPPPPPPSDPDRREENNSMDDDDDDVEVALDDFAIILDLDHTPDLAFPMLFSISSPPHDTFNHDDDDDTRSDVSYDDDMSS